MTTANKLPRIRALTFDLDDTLWPLASTLQQAEQASWIWLDQHAPRITHQFSLTESAQLRRQLHRDDPNLRHQISKVRIATIKKMALESGYAEEKSTKIAADAFNIFLARRQSVTPYDGVEKILGALSENFLIGAISNGNADIYKTPIGQYFSFALSAEQVNASKPSPIIFNTAIELLCRQTNTPIKAAQVIHIGDSYELDISAAKRCDYKTIWLRVNSDDNTDKEDADYIISDITELTQAIEALTA